MQRSALYRSRKLSNEYLLAKFGFDRAENEPFQVCPLSAYRSPRYAALLALLERRALFPQEQADKAPKLHFVVNSVAFEVFCGAMILLNAIFLGWDTYYPPGSARPVMLMLSEPWPRGYWYVRCLY